MAAETITATRAADSAPIFKGRGSGILCQQFGTIEIAGGNLLEAGDVLRMVRVPPMAIVTGGRVYGDDLDTGTETLDFDIGWLANGGSGTYDAADADGFGNLGVMSGDVIAEWKPVAGIFVPFQGLLLTDGPIQFTRETFIALTVNAAAAAGGTGTLTMVVDYLNP